MATPNRSQRKLRVQSHKPRLNRRSAKGFTLVEALVSILIGALLSIVFLDMFSKLVRTNATTQNEVCANAIAQEMMETTSALGYDYLAYNVGPGTSSLLINQTDLAQVGPVMKPNPVLLDLASKTWTPRVSAGKFRGTATYKVEAAPAIPEAIKVTCTVSWSDGANSQGRAVSTSTLLTRSGLNKWAP